MVKADTPKPLTILVVDDHESVRKKICERLTSHTGFEVICEAVNGLEGVRNAEELQPDVVDLDISIPVFGGIEAAARIRRVAPKARIVFLSQHTLPAIAEAALAVGGHAYVVKSAAAADLIPAIQAAIQGKRFVSQLEQKVAMTNNPTKSENVEGEKPAITLPGVVEKIVEPITPNEPEKAQIAVQGAEDLYRELRVENSLENSSGEKVRLKPGAQVDVTIEAPVDAVEKRPI